jgi:HAD superfamily hydrolase (TIGR01509 family)
MDGVIVDSMPYHVQAWERFLAGKGIDPAALNGRMHGKHNDELIREIFGHRLDTQTVRAMGEQKETIYREAILPHLEAALVPGVRDFLRETREHPKAVASNAEPKNVRFILEEANLSAFFLAALDGYQVEFGKPHPEIYGKAAAALGVPPAGCLVFEDSQTGIDAALAAGMTVVAVNTNRVRLTGCALEIENFLDPQLKPWLASASLLSSLSSRN